MEWISCKNRIGVNCSNIFVQLPNTTPATFVTASIDDFDQIARHRWRWIDARCVTTMRTPEDGLERPYTLESVILDIDRNVTVHHRNRNPHDFRRSNLTLTNTRSRNLYLNEGNYTLILMRNAQTAIIDTDLTKTVSPYTWNAVHHRGSYQICARYTEEGKVKRVQLPRLILGLSRQDNRPVDHLNKDIFDCRRHNLRIRGE